MRHLRCKLGWLLDRAGPSPRLCLTRLISTPSSNSDKSEGAQRMVNIDLAINDQVEPSFPKLGPSWATLCDFNNSQVEFHLSSLCVPTSQVDFHLT